MTKRHALSFLRPTPVKAGLLCVIACCLFWYLLDNENPAFLGEVDNRIVDSMFRFRGPEDSTGSVVIVDIDGDSLKEYGQWPWPRNIVADLTQKIYGSGALVTGFDIIFSEKDRSSPGDFLSQYRDALKGDENIERILTSINDNPALQHDHLLGKAIAGGTSVLGYKFIFREDFLKNITLRPSPSVTINIYPEEVSTKNLKLVSAYRPVLNIPELSIGSSEGFLNVFPDSGGRVRKIPLFVHMDDVAYPSLPFEMMRLVKDEQEILLHASNEGDGEYRSLLGVSLGDSFIPTDDFGQLTINFRGPYNTFLYLSAGDVLKDIGTDILRDKYVIIGSSASGLIDLVATPYSARLPGVEMHANVLDNLIKNDAMVWEKYSELGLTYILIALAGVIIIASFVILGPLPGFATTILAVACVVAGNYYLLFLNHHLFAISYVLLSLAVIFLAVTASNYFFEGRKRSFIRKAFSQYVSPSVVNELLKNPERLNLSIETREVTILFCDIRDFTTFSELTPPAELGQFLNTYFSLLTDVIIRHHGMVDKYIGDAIMAVWGTPLDNPNHPTDAVQAALEMVQTVEAKKDLLQLAGKNINIGIGINTGRVSAGNFGSSKRFDYTVLGDNVNLASRIEGLTKFYQRPILISEFTKKKLAITCGCRFIDRVMVKGRNKEVELFEPLLPAIGPGANPDDQTKYHQAILYYKERRFSESLSVFKELNRNKPDTLYELYISRNRSLMKNPPQPDWIAVHDHN